ncbi:MAG: Fmu (Sun) domain-containing protein [Bacteroidota bacterium]
MNSRLNYYLSVSQILVKDYSGLVPFSRILKKYFLHNKKHGSRDRKIISDLCFSYFRLGRALPTLSFDTRIKVALFLCKTNSKGYDELFEDEYLNNWSIDNKIRLLFIEKKFSDFKLYDVFPLIEQINFSNKNEFVQNHFYQPYLFIRIRKNKYLSVTEKLQRNNISFKEIEKNCLALLNSTKLDSILKINDEAVIQDLSSQRIVQFFELIKSSNSSIKNVWDCCAASGGKSILAVDTLENIQLTVSDVRTLILENLKQRFLEANIFNYTSFIADLSVENKLNKKFDLIICDVPCSGSGTWSRTPEMLCNFNLEKLNNFVELQKKISSNALNSLSSSGYFLYITCSVYQEENENVVNYLANEFGLKIIKSSYILGFNNHADTMFAALLKF